ncbi:expressed protein [Chlorella variabilis]|uniref:Expressed protein n=1 Tax=Chlorella variabilis TaxID=554065 RepID=E1ZLN5_CHLVA|nr:expressed protein [Chlorella variabilis]EFN53165.1 expressed protein [Chlorella variabilis]|eukprot:XP_005845267.1 expressed protein [Chlorella variabilis]
MADGDTLADVFARLRLGGCQVTVSGCAADSSDRHNVGRIPAIDYFARKLAKGSSEEHWRGLTFGKAGEAAALPDVHASPEAYLTDMQAHTALEFQAAAAAALASAEGRHPEPAQLWWNFGWVSDAKWRALRTRGQSLDFSDEGEPWVKHLVQVKETDSYHVARLARRDPDSGDDVLVLLPTVEAGGRAREVVQMRSLGYLGSFLLQYTSAQALRYQLRTRTLPPAAQHMLQLAADPTRQLSSSGQGTLRRGPVHLLTDTVPINAGQRAAVEGLQGGLSIIHGPPGTGKSTTIFHIVESRVQPRAQVLVTCSRNQAVDAVVGKLAGVEGSLLVFGREERLGDKAKQYTLTARLARHPTVAAWLDLMRQLQELRDNTVPPGTLAARVRQAEAVLAAVVAAGASDGVAQEEMRTLRRLLERLRQRDYSTLAADILQPAITRLLARVLPEVKAAAKREILASTRVYACTIDSTPRMVFELADHGVDVDVDTILMDEAGCVAEMAVPPLIKLAPANLVLVGDHLQLPAYSDLVSPPPNHVRSFMERAVALAVPAAMLTNQYRMHPAICRAISAEFYADRLHTAAAAAARRALAEPCRMVQVGGKEVWHQGGGYSNPVEASKAVRVARKAAKELRELGIRHPTIYIITIYNRQRDLLERLVAKEPALRGACDCQVLSIDACQGDEADAVVVSTVRNAFCGSENQHLSSFFRDRRRVNVAMSRARHLCVVVGSLYTLRLPKARPWSAVLADYDGFD